MDPASLNKVIGLLSTLVVKELGKQFYMLVDCHLKWIVKGHLNKKKVESNKLTKLMWRMHCLLCIHFDIQAKSC